MPGVESGAFCVQQWMDYENSNNDDAKDIYALCEIQECLPT